MTARQRGPGPGAPAVRAFSLPVGAGTTTCVEVHDTAHVGLGLTALGLHAPRPVVVVVGGAGGLDVQEQERLRPVFTAGIVPALQSVRGVGIDGGTHVGTMRLLGEARSAARATFPLLGVVALGTVRLPGDDRSSSDVTALDPNHTHVLLVPGETWGDEVQWIADAATTLAGTARSATVLVNGGEIAYEDVARSVESGRPVVVVAGSGRTADELAHALDGRPGSARAAELAASSLLHTALADDPSALSALITSLLSGSGSPRGVAR